MSFPKGPSQLIVHERDKQTQRVRDRESERETVRERDRQTDRDRTETERQTDRQSQRQTETQRETERNTPVNLSNTWAAIVHSFQVSDLKSVDGAFSLPPTR